MIFVGDGALLKDALQYSLGQGHPIEYVFCSNDEIADFLKINDLAYKITDDINGERETIRQQLKDNIIISVNNAQIFKAPILSIDQIHIYNIHNGILPGYRGRPEICILYAILHEEHEYGVSLHRIDKGIDTGPCYAIKKFAIAPDDTFQQVMLNAIGVCARIYRDNIHRIITGQLEQIDLGKARSRLYSYRDLENIGSLKNNVNFKKATKLGIFRLWFRELDRTIREIL
ncbi:formyltransferase family protein [Puia dinghuensis]|uniref:Formyl transferase N-terminal domain-containing protein n=1 Tax=Puia dinghuensis TaxID=1792502 RepID=A0A8J2U5X7_9BACT|nr:formyltransferase family protein [Puia dinghuensis]GGA81118.1 hypothetical protein GCM10011511_00100 [Puia dinghuensis]